jgi:hypothetical protein
MERMTERKVMAHNKKSASLAQGVQAAVMAAMIGTAGFAAVYSTAAVADDSSATPDTSATTDGSVPQKKPGFVEGAMSSTYDYIGLNRTRVDDVHTFYVGVGDTNSLLHANVEMVGQFGHVYAKVGEFVDGKQIAGQVGFRIPYNYTHDKDNDGVYFGAYAGQIENSGIASKHVNRLGGALEMSYLLMNKTSLTAASVSLGFAKPNKQGEADEQKVTPILMFGLTWGFGLF